MEEREEIKGFMKLPIKSMSAENMIELDNAYQHAENMGLSTENINDEDYAQDDVVNVKANSILIHKEADDGNTEISMSSMNGLFRVYMKYDLFLDILKEELDGLQ